MYVARDGTELIPHNRFATGNVLLQSSAATSFAKLNVNVRFLGRNEKVSNYGSIPITLDCNVVAIIVFEEGFHQPIKRTKESVFLDVTVFRHTLVD
ncbi:hypothetical protein TNCV_930511 [Trichonephila clavipes]|uniref:Uncharacterized protein n=1 Tax=Trichonephila clavipes TaxID=2585209 RepID=A0A8X7BCP8_TRICX|nr:hypothetical protein TNCV_930511 [Trichonephila clavipes]